MWPPVCAHGSACEHNTALPDLLAYGDARRTGRRLRCRRPPEPARAQRCEAGMPTADTHWPPLRSSHAAVRAPCGGCGSVAVCRRVEFSSRRAVPKEAGLYQGQSGFKLPRTARVHTCTHTRVPVRAHTRSGTYTRTRAHTHKRLHVRARTRMHKHTHSYTCACTPSCTHSCTHAVVCTHTHVSKHGLLTHAR
jgi:hypothetical protein